MVNEALDAYLEQSRNRKKDSGYLEKVWKLGNQTSFLPHLQKTKQPSQ